MPEVDQLLDAELLAALSSLTAIARRAIRLAVRDDDEGLEAALADITSQSKMVNRLVRSIPVAGRLVAQSQASTVFAQVVAHLDDVAALRSVAAWRPEPGATHA